MPMRNMSKTDSGCGASCAATSPETIAAGVGRDGSYVVTDAPRATGRRSMGTIVQQPPGALPVVAVVPPDLRRCLLRRWCSRRRRPRPPARSPHASLKARSGRSRSPPVPSGPSGALHTGGARSLGVAWRVVSKLGQAPQAPRRPTIGRACVSWPCRRPPAPRPGPAGPAAAFLLVVLVAPLVFQAPEGPAAREARRPHFVRRRASKPARALRTLRRPPHRRRLWFWCECPGPAVGSGRCFRGMYSAISHVIPLSMFQSLKSDRCYSAVFELSGNGVLEELRATLGWGGSVGVAGGTSGAWLWL